MIKRREFLAQVGTLSAGLMLAPGTLLANVDPEPLPQGVGAVSVRDHFLTLLNSNFRLSGGTGQGRVKLVKIQDLPSSTRHQQFSLVFESTDRAAIPAGSYRAESREADPFLIYLQPISPIAGNQHYVADFSLLWGHS